MNPLTVERTISVPRSIEDCYRYLRDFSTCAQWDPGVHSARKITPGTPSVGSEFDIELNGPLGTIPMQYRITHLEEPMRIELSGSGKGFTVDDHIELGASDDAITYIRYAAVMDLRWVPAPLQSIAKLACERVGDKAMAGLQAALTDRVEIPDAVENGLAEKLVLPAASRFTSRGYRKLDHAGLSWRMDGKTVLITGPTGGLGLAAAKELARLGAHLLLVGRDRQRLNAAVRDIEDFAGPAKTEILEADLSLVAKCREVASQVLERHPRLDVLINNAGALPNERTETVEGNELSLAINLLAPYTLTRDLLPALREAQGRVVNVVSGGMYLQSLNMQDLQFERRRYDGPAAYAQAKRATTVITEHFANSPDAAQVAFHAMHPGWAATPGVTKSLPGFNRVMGPWLRSPVQGADTMVWLAIHPQLGPGDYPGVLWFDRALRPTDIKSGTVVSTADREALLSWLEETCA